MAQSIVPNVYALFWMERGEPYVLMFDSSQMVACMQESENLRRRKRLGENISHVNFASEHPDLVGEAGAADPHPEYSKHHWKRRLDPNTPLGRPSGQPECKYRKCSDPSECSKFGHCVDDEK